MKKGMTLSGSGRNAALREATIQNIKSSFKRITFTLDGIVPWAVQTGALIAAQEVHIYVFTFSVYCLYSSGRQRYYFSVEGPRNATTLRSVFDPSTHCSTTDIMRECGEKLPAPVEALG